MKFAGSTTESLRLRSAFLPGIVLFALLLVGTAARAASPSLSVTDSHNRHNLSVSREGGTNPTKSTVESRVCIFCHTPHHAGEVTPLWSRLLSVASYTPYASSTLKVSAAPGQPTGVSRLCLSCHDGTIALGMLYTEDGSGYVIAPGLGAIPVSPRSGDRPLLETDLSDDHPVSFSYADAAMHNGEISPVAILPVEISLESGNVECTACHDPHADRYPPADADPDHTGHFLVLDNSQDSALCRACHDPAGWTGSAMQLPGDACGNCHRPHSAGQPARLLRGAEPQETCLLNCHNGAGVEPDIASALTFSGAHQTGAVALSGSHDAAESPPDFDPAQPHVTCADCHNPHQAMVDTPLDDPPYVNGALQAVTTEILVDGTEVTAATEYEICYKCHGGASCTPVAVVRKIQENDESLRFSGDNPSYHPVTAAGAATAAPSLRADMLDVSGNPVRSLASGRIYCTDCHNHDQGPTAQGAAAIRPNGPHGSAYPHLLLAQYEMTYPAAYFQDNYTLCYRCHDPAVLLDPAQSAFPNHRAHVAPDAIVDPGGDHSGKEVPCSVCHDPHGVPAVAGATVTENAHLINFDTGVVDPLSASYDSGAKSCTVSCHTTGSPDPQTHNY